MAEPALGTARRRALPGRRALAALAALLVTALPPGNAVVAAGAPARRPRATLSPPQPVTPLLGLCDATGVLDVLGDLSDADANKRRDQIALLQGRILDCARKIATASSVTPSATPYWVSNLPTPMPAPKPGAACTNPAAATTDSNRFALFEILQRCSAFWSASSATATPAPSATTLPSVASRPTFYVFATGAVDPGTATVLIRSVVGRLTQARRRAAAALPAPAAAGAPPDVVVAGRADWTATESFTSQCQLDPNTRGALVIRTSMPETYRHNYVVLVANFTRITASVEMLGCGAEDHNLAVSPLSLYSRQAVSGSSHEDALTLGLFSSIATFLATDKSRTTVTTGGGTTTITKTDSTAPVFTGSVIGYFEGENLNLPAQNPSVQLDVAGRRFADDALSRLQALCSQAQIRRLAEQGDPKNVPLPPLEHRSLPYKAAFEYIDDCGLFANFDPHG